MMPTANEPFRANKAASSEGCSIRLKMVDDGIGNFGWKTCTNFAVTWMSCYHLMCSEESVAGSVEMWMKRKRLSIAVVLSMDDVKG